MAGRLVRAPLMLTALLVLVAGCVVPEDTAPTSRLLDYCPQWEQGPGMNKESVSLNASVARMDRSQNPDLTYQGRALNMYRVHIDRLDVQGGTLELRAYKDANLTSGLNWYDHRASGSNPSTLAFRGGGNETNHDFDTLLTVVSQSDTGPGYPIILNWVFLPDRPGEGQGVVEYTVTFHYRVCGALDL